MSPIFVREILVDPAEVFAEEEFQNLREIELIADNGTFSYISNISLRLKYDSQNIFFFYWYRMLNERIFFSKQYFHVTSLFIKQLINLLSHEMKWNNFSKSI